MSAADAAVLAGKLTHRLWRRGVRTASGCLDWPLTVNWAGYGRTTVYVDGRGRSIAVHRAAWLVANGPVPAGMHICHRCDNRRCYEPKHLFLGTAADNTADMMAKGRHVRTGMRLTDEQVTEARARFAAGETQTALARAFGVGINTMHCAVRGKTWTHLPTPSSPAEAA
jgi:hypothetical protein